MKNFFHNILWASEQKCFQFSYNACMVMKEAVQTLRKNHCSCFLLLTPTFWNQVVMPLVCEIITHTLLKANLSHHWVFNAYEGDDAYFGRKGILRHSWQHLHTLSCSISHIWIRIVTQPCVGQKEEKRKKELLKLCIQPKLVYPGSTLSDIISIYSSYQKAPY